MKSIFALLLMVCMGSCKHLPKEKLKQLRLTHKTEIINDSLSIFITNPLPSILQVTAKDKQNQLTTYLDTAFPVLLAPFQDSVFSINISATQEEPIITFSSVFGNPLDTFRLKSLEYPFPHGRKYKIIQGYNGKFSHNATYSRYALDFSLGVGDTICAAAGGFVVGVIDGYTYGGKDRKWRDYANFITLYHPDMNILTQYVHLVKNGSLVEVGDTVLSGQKIAISGETGFTTIPHLHFNVIYIGEAGARSIPAEFENGVLGKELRRGQYVSH
ncbi:MAG: M23 family metallopeptidase [Bacteroidota bacterium]